MAVIDNNFLRRLEIGDTSVQFPKSSLATVSKVGFLGNGVFQLRYVLPLISVTRKIYPLATTGFPNLFFAETPQERQVLINNLEKAIAKILPKIRIPYLNNDKVFKFTGFFDEIEKIIRDQDPGATVYLGGGGIRSILSFIYKELYEAYNKGQDPQARLTQICQGDARFSTQKEDETISALDVLGIKSDIDIYVQFSENFSNQQATLDRAEQFINKGIQFLADSPYKDLLCPPADVKEYQIQLKRASSNGGSPIDWIAFPLTPLSGSNFRVPENCTDVLEHFCTGTLIYKHVDNAEEPGITTLRMYRSLFELPFLELDEEGSIRFIRDLRVIESSNLDKSSQKIKYVFEKIVRNTRFPDRLNFEIQNKATEVNVLLRQQVLKNISQKFHSNKNLPALPELLPSRFNATELDLEMMKFLEDQNLFIPVDEFIKLHTDNGSLYHGTPDKKNILPMLRGNLVVSTSHQGNAMYGWGFYSTNNLEIAQQYSRGSEGQIISFKLKQDHLRILDLQTLPLNVLNDLNTKAIEKKIELHEYLSVYLKIDIVINHCILILNNRCVSLEATQQTFFKEALVDKALDAVEFFKNFKISQINLYEPKELVKKLENLSKIYIVRGLLSEEEVNRSSSSIETALRNGLETALFLVKNKNNRLNFQTILQCYPELKNDKNIVLAAVQQDGSYLNFISDQLKNDKNIVLAAVTQYGSALQFASDELKNDKDVVLAAVKQDLLALEFASDELKNDKDVVLAAVKRNGWVLGFVSDQLKNDRDVVLEAIKQHPLALQFASDRIKNNKDVVLVAVKRDGWVLKFVSDQLKNDKDVVLAAVKQNGSALQLAGDQLKNDKDVVLAAVKRNGWVLKFVSDQLKNDRDVVLEAIKQDPQALEFASDELKNNRDVVLAAVKQSRHALHFASKRIQNDNYFRLKIALFRIKGIYENVLGRLSTPFQVCFSQNKLA